MRNDGLKLVTVTSVLFLCLTVLVVWLLAGYSDWVILACSCMKPALPVGLIFTNKVILVVNFNTYSTEIYGPQILQAEMILLAPRSKGSDSKANDKQSPKHYWLRQYIAESTEILRINLIYLFCPLENDKSPHQNPVNSNIICADRLLVSSENFRGLLFLFQLTLYCDDVLGMHVVHIFFPQTSLLLLVH